MFAYKTLNNTLNFYEIIPNYSEIVEYRKQKLLEVYRKKILYVARTNMKNGVLNPERITPYYFDFELNNSKPEGFNHKEFHTLLEYEPNTSELNYILRQAIHKREQFVFSTTMNDEMKYFDIPVLEYQDDINGSKKLSGIVPVDQTLFELNYLTDLVFTDNAKAIFENLQLLNYYAKFFSYHMNNQQSFTIELLRGLQESVAISNNVEETEANIYYGGIILKRLKNFKPLN